MTGAVPSPALHVCSSRNILLINSHACMQHRAPHNLHAHMHAEAWPWAPLNPIESDLRTRVKLKQPLYCRVGGAKAGEAALAAREAEVHRAAAALQDRARQLAARQQQLDARCNKFLSACTSRFRVGVDFRRVGFQRVSQRRASHQHSVSDQSSNIKLHCRHAGGTGERAAAQRLAVGWSPVSDQLVNRQISL